MAKILHKCKIGTYNANCKYKVNKVLCCADSCGFMGEPVTEQPQESTDRQATLKHEPKWFEKYYH